HDVIRAAGNLHVDQLVLVLDLYRLYARRTRIRVLRESRLLDGAVLRREEQELVVGERSYRNEGGDFRLGGDVDQIHHRLSLGRSSSLRDFMDLEPEAAPVFR